MHWIIIISVYTTLHGSDVGNVQQKVYPEVFDTPAKCHYWRDLLADENTKAYGQGNSSVGCWGLDSGVFE
jgi:hypothetical protein